MAVRIVSIIDQIGQSLNQNTAAAALFVDFKAAFNQLWYKGLWLKLRGLGCPLHLLARLRSYLKNRTAYIEIKEADLTVPAHESVSLKNGENAHNRTILLGNEISTGQEGHPAIALKFFKRDIRYQEAELY
ncbi:unnamed protein product [Didymodactylos carnosus]|uniref:Reverse transcriptase domain-containing protein n=2 Tax=Didymodactylos carnosus TaxID=1234261 RepID=A0A813R458_9BILA|nr:unnamed protein product [Didymodactylos carnosus]CAF3559328.1 unnamed protein product [Didymodactylos carnosus]